VVCIKLLRPIFVVRLVLSDHILVAFDLERRLVCSVNRSLNLLNEFLDVLLFGELALSLCDA